VLVTLVGCRDSVPEEVRERAIINGAAGALEAAGTATAVFAFELNGYGGTLFKWKGTTRWRFGDELVSETEFDTFAISIAFVERNPHPFGTRRLVARDVRRITVGEDHFYQSSEFDLLAGKTWLEVEPGWYFEESLSEIGGPDFPLADPLWHLAVLASADGGLVYGGDTTKEIDGVTVTRYDLDCHLDKGCSYPAGSDRVERLFPRPARNWVLVGVWVDEHGAPRELEVLLTLYDGDGDQYRLEGTVTFRGLGEPVKIETPLDDQVQVGWDFTEVLAWPDADT